MSYTCEIEYTIRVKASVDSFCVDHKDATVEAMQYGKDDIEDTLMKYLHSDDTVVEGIEFTKVKVLSCEPVFYEDYDRRY